MLMLTSVAELFRWEGHGRAASGGRAEDSGGTPGAHVASWPALRAEIATWANLVTLGRLVFGTAAFGVGLATDSQWWNYAGLAIYWGGDLLDGYLARRLNQETVLGAEFDILTDRILVSLFYVGYVSAHPEKMLVAMLFLFEFMILDHFLSNQFVRWPIRSPNYFYRVDGLAWAWLWSQPAKALNTGLVTLLTIGFQSPWPALVAVIVLIAVRVGFVARLIALSADERAAARAPRMCPGCDRDEFHNLRSSHVADGRCLYRATPPITIP